MPHSIGGPLQHLVNVLGRAVVALRNDVHINKNERIGQFIILPKMPTVQFETVDDLENENRKGFGHTGVN